METLILIIILVLVAKNGIKDGSLHWQKSRTANRRGSQGKSVPKRAASAVQHDVGYWGHQVLHGFPQTRHGLASGWTAGRAAQAQGAAERQKAKADHLTLRARLMPEIREHQRRQQDALEQIRKAQDPEPEAPQQAGGEAGTTRRVDGKPETGSDKRFFDARESGYKGWIDQDGIPVPDPSDPDPARNQYPPGEGSPGSRESTSPIPSPPEGNTVPASDTTYDSVIQAMKDEQAAAEARTAEQQAASQRASQQSEEMQALDLDPDTLGAIADHLDAQQAAVTAQEKVMETAEAVQTALTRGHAGLAEAHQDAPVQAADKEFYAA